MQEFNVITPESTEELLQAIDDYQNKNYRFGAGFTDLLVELKKEMPSDLNVINLSNIKAPGFCSIKIDDDCLTIGSLVTASEITSNEIIKNKFPVLHKAADTLASRQIRQVATVGGNICTASPAGDISTALCSLEAECEILAADNKTRKVPINEFFTGVRRTALNNNEILKSIRIYLPEDGPRIFSDFIKIGSRRSMECSVVSLAYHIYTDDSGVIEKPGIAIGSAAPTIMFTKSACDFIIGKNINNFNDKDCTEFADKVMEYASPISDVRGSAWYRKKVLYNISKSIFELD